jgi:ABC-type branched-subunit amino acid transport system substrate-binding protein
VLGLVLPLSGRSRLLGQQLAEGEKALSGEDEDRPEGGPVLKVRDGGDADAARAAIAALADEDRAFAAVGLFDQGVADAAADAAAEHHLPLVMLTLSDAPVKRGGLLWRALHTPEMAARAAADAGLARGGREVAILAPRNGYGRTLAALFRSAWEAGGGHVSFQTDWDPADPRWPVVAKAARAAAFDTVYIPDGPVGAALLASHLAAENVWSRGPTPRFAGDRKVREVQVLGTPEWYEASLLSQAGRYLEGALVPVPFAAETPGGGAFAERLRKVTQRDPTPFDALLADALSGCQAAYARHGADGAALADDFAAVKVAQASAGLRFDRPEALDRLLLLEVRNGAFAPAAEPSK